MPPLFPKLIIKSFNGKEFNIQSIHDDLLIIDKNNKYFSYTLYIYIETIMILKNILELMLSFS